MPLLFSSLSSSLFLENFPLKPPLLIVFPKNLSRVLTFSSISPQGGWEGGRVMSGREEGLKQPAMCLNLPALYLPKGDDQNIQARFD